MALNFLAVAIGVGLLYTLLLAEVLGLAAGGLVVPGYVALELMRPWGVAFTLLAAWIAFMTVRLLSAHMVVYGRRKTAIIILTGYLAGALLEATIGGIFTLPTETGANAAAGTTVPDPRFLEVRVIGYIIPGLVAIWFDRQGVLPTLAGLLVTSVLVRLTLIAAAPEAVMAYDAAQSDHLPDWLRTGEAE